MMGITINTPTMSMKAVTISTHSLPAPLSFIGGRYPGSFRGGLPQRRRRHAATDDPRQRDDRERVRDHLHELAGNRMRSLEPDLEGLRGREQQARERRTLRLPPPEDGRRQRDE